MFRGMKKAEKADEGWKWSILIGKQALAKGLDGNRLAFRPKANIFRSYKNIRKELRIPKLVGLSKNCVFKWIVGLSMPRWLSGPAEAFSYLVNSR